MHILCAFSEVLCARVLKSKKKFANYIIMYARKEKNMCVKSLTFEGKYLILHRKNYTI